MEMSYFQSGNEYFPLRDGNEMTFAGELEEMTFLGMTFFHHGRSHFHFHDENEFPRSEFTSIMEMGMTFAMMERSHSEKSHFLELASKSHFIFIT